MTRVQRSWVGMACLTLAILSTPPSRTRGASPAGPAAGPDPARELARAIDHRLEALWSEAGIEPAPPADDAEFLRRVSLDLVGKIPTAAEARDFLDDPAPDKRGRIVDRLLASPAYLVRATEIWKALLLPETDTDARARALAPTFEAWLRRKVDEGAGYDEIVREVLTLPLGGRGRRGNDAYDPRSEPSPLAFYAAKDAKPEALAAGTSRVFLGIRLECAECHNHPFDRWTREEFWSFTAFFAGVSKQGPADGYGQIREAPNVREMAIPGTDRVVQARLLDGREPDWGARPGGRAILADWITARDNPYFARAAVNRTWARFFGVGLVEPVDDMGEGSTAIAPELLDEMARRFREHDYDLKFLIRALTATRSYQLTSAVGQSGSSLPELFSAMPVRGLDAGQLFDSLARATGARADDPGFGFDLSPARARFLELFSDRGEMPTEAQTSILQALTLMNGQIVADATSLDVGPMLGAVAEAPYLDTDGRIEALYLATLTRRPRPEERALMADYVRGGGPAGDASQALADILWALLNSPEFKLNH